MGCRWGVEQTGDVHWRVNRGVNVVCVTYPRRGRAQRRKLSLQLAGGDVVLGGDRGGEALAERKDRVAAPQCAQLSLKRARSREVLAPYSRRQ